MKYASDNLIEKLDEIIRPAAKLYFEVGTNTIYSLKGLSAALLSFDTRVAPALAPSSCTNGYYYSVVGDDVSIDDPNRICAPEDVYSTPSHSVPFGICPISAPGVEVLIGSNNYAFNFKDIISPITLSFVGGLIPERLRVESWDAENGEWFTEATIDNPDLSEELKFIPANYGRANTTYRRFWVVNNSKGGRYQLNWIREERSEMEGIGEPVIFTNNMISKVSVDEDTDLTSQNLPSYIMTVECLDVDELYTPESEYWDKQFVGDTPCYFKAGYEENGVIEYLPILCGKMTEKPSYSQGKITFKVEVDWKIGWTINIDPIISENLNVGDETDGMEFSFLINYKKLFDSHDIFGGYDDTLNSTLNYSGEIATREARQLVANALGGYIRAGFNTCDLYNTSKIQYRSPDDVLTRYGQIACNYENTPKVGRISVTSTVNTVSPEYVDVETPDRYVVGGLESRSALFRFALPSSDFSKIEIINAQSTVPGATAYVYSDIEIIEIHPDGTTDIGVPLTATEETSIKPICRFYKRISESKEVAETIFESKGDEYTNDNKLITNDYITNKVKRVARLISDMSEKYEIDIVQDLRYEIGDIIRIETQKNVFKDCVITSIRNTFPGTKGHITCRRVFSLSASEYAVLDPVGLSVRFGLTSIEIIKASEKAGFVGVMNASADTYIFVLGAETFEENQGGVITEKDYNGALIDLNYHVWKFAVYVVPSGTEIITDAPIVELPDYDLSTGATQKAYGAIALLKKIYDKQGMSAPADWGCEWQE